MDPALERHVKVDRVVSPVSAYVREIVVSIMEEVNRVAVKQLPEQKAEVEIRSENVTKDEQASRKEAASKPVNPGQVLPLMQVSLRNMKRVCVRMMARLVCRTRPRYYPHS